MLTQEAPNILDIDVFQRLASSGPVHGHNPPAAYPKAPDEACRLIKSGEEFVMQIKIGDDWIALYRFDLQEQFLSDYEVRNWYMSTHPSSLFATELLVARPDIDRRYTLRNKSLKVRYLNNITERRSLDSIADLRAKLADVFRLTLPDTQDLEAALSRVIHRPA